MSSANLHQHPGYKYQFSPNCTDEDSWNKCMDAVRQHDHDMCKGWVKNLDALLVFVRARSQSFDVFRILIAFAIY